MTDTTDIPGIVSVVIASHQETLGKRRVYHCVSMFKGRILNDMKAGGLVARFQMCGIRKKVLNFPRPLAEKKSGTIAGGEHSSLAKANKSFMARLKLAATVSRTTRLTFQTDMEALAQLCTRVQAVQDGKSEEKYEDIVAEARENAFVLVNQSSSGKASEIAPTLVEILNLSGSRGFMSMCTAFGVTPDNELVNVASKLVEIVNEVEVEKKAVAAAVRTTHYSGDRTSGMF